jgi:hypothetical protein
MRRLTRLSVSLLLLLSACSRPHEPAERVVHEERALAKANAAWADVFAQRAEEAFSPRNIRRFAPYTATLENGVWIVRGTMPADPHGPVPSARVRAADGVTTVQSIDR